MGRPKKYATDEERKAAASARQRERRQQKSIEETLARQARDAESKRKRRQNESSEETLVRQAREAECKRRRRQNESSEETLERQMRNAADHRDRRQNESNEERNIRRAHDAEFHRQQRTIESPAIREVRLSRDRQIYKKRVMNLAEQNQRDIQQHANSVTDDETTIVQHSCGDMDVICTYCGSFNFLAEKPADNRFTKCCQKGKVKLQRQDYPDLLESLMNGTHLHSKNFLDNIRCFNSSNAFASLGANISPPPGFGPYVFRIHGQIYHRTGTLYPEEGDPPKFAQLYVLDASEATEQRMQAAENEKCNKNLMHQIAVLLTNINPFSQAYKMLQEVEAEEKQRAKENNSEMPNIVMAIKQDRQQDPRRYNMPRVSEVAVVFENDDGEPPFERDILIHLKPDIRNPLAPKTERISLLHSNLDALLYPLFFPMGEQGWHENLLQQGSSKRITQMQFYSYLLAVRKYFNPLLSGGKLTQQYFVDAYVKIEANRLNFIRLNQKQLKVEDYCVLQEHLVKRSIEKGIPVGKTVILPSSFEGSPRNMQQRYQDAMAIVAKYGRPDLFVTMTCNAKWKDITDNLKPWQRVEDRPDLVARVFQIKLKSLLKEIKDGLFGKVTAMIHVIEFQKRGLPHAHILIILDSESKLRTEEDIDKVVWAEIPDKEKYPLLHEIVLSNMIHGPCGAANTKCPCMENGKCTKGFPKDLMESTLRDRDGYPCYRRLKGDVVHNGKLINNSWVVPYNPYLLMKYNCHINVEVCASIKSVKYLFKYVYKGHDKANVEIQEKILNHDEATQHVDSRYVSPPEAAWRIFAFRMHEQSHTIIRLAVHLPNKQQLYFFENAEQEQVENSLSKVSTLMEYFTLNERDPDARKYYYREIPEHYVWDKIWKPRKRGAAQVIGRMYIVSVTEQERYYLRLLLLHVKGALSFEDLRTENGVVYETFKEAANALGLMLGDNVWRRTIEDGITLSMPRKLREMFAYICVFGPPTHPDQLWAEFKEHFIEDYCMQLHNKTGSCANCEAFAMKDVQDVFILHGKSFSDFKLPPPAVHVPYIQQEYNIDDELMLAADMSRSLNPQQEDAYRTVLAAIENPNRDIPKCFFIDGPGGSGKTYLYEVLMHRIRGDGKDVLPSATTGIAANLLQGGRTMHSWFGIPVPVNETSVSRIKPGTIAAQALHHADLLIIDECTMAPKYALAVINRALQEVMTTDIADKNNVPFGGKVFVLGGDFRQCLPVVPNGTRADIVDSCLKMSNLWKHFTILPLISNMRSLDPAYSDWLLKLGNGELGNEDNLGEDVIEIPPDMLSSGCIVSDIFGENVEIDVNNRDNIERAASHAILCPTNADVEDLNFQIMERMPGEYYVYKSDDSVEVDNDLDARENYPVEFLNTLTPSGMPCHRLRLKVGTIIMLLRNLNTRKGLCNGTRLIVTGLHPNVIQAKVITGSAEGEDTFIPRIDLCPSETGLPFRLKRRQFPVKPAFAMTINKSQGQTFERVGIYLPEPVFGHGQLYVAFSRVKQRCNVKVQVVDTPLQGILLKNSKKVFTRNVVFKNIL